MKDLEAATSYLGIRITRDRKRRSIWIDQEDYIHNALTCFNLLNANDTKTPLPEGVHLVAATEPTPPEKLTRYQQLIRTLLYASIETRPDIAFAVTRLSRYNANPTDEHHKYAQYILRYLKGTIKTRVHLVTWAHVSLALCLNHPWCMWCYMRLPIAFRDNQQISLPVCFFGSCIRPIRVLNFSTLTTGKGLVNRSAGFSSPAIW